MKLITLALICFGVGIVTLCVMAYILIRSETQPPKLELPKDWNDKEKDV